MPTANLLDEVVHVIVLGPYDFMADSERFVYASFRLNPSLFRPGHHWV